MNLFNFFIFNISATTEISTFPYTTLFRSKGSVAGLIYQLVGGLRAGMGYCGCANIGQLHREAKLDRKSTRLNSSHSQISYAVFCLKKKTHEQQTPDQSIRSSR